MLTFKFNRKKNHKKIVYSIENFFFTDNTCTKPFSRWKEGCDRLYVIYIMKSFQTSVILPNDLREYFFDLIKKIGQSARKKSVVSDLIVHRPEVHLYFASSTMTGQQN